MERTFEILKHPEKGYLAIKRGFSWPAFFFSFIWALTKRLWFCGLGFFLLALLVGVIKSNSSPFGSALVGLIFSFIIGRKANSWLSAAAEAKGYTYLTMVSAKSPEAAIANFLKGEARSNTSFGLSLPIPKFLQRTYAVVWLTWKAAFRYKLFWVLTSILLGTVIALPILIKDDGTASGFTQILLTYTLGSISVLLGFATLWISCGSLARDIEEAQIQMVVTKPIARWQIWLGKWMGLVSLNALLLLITGSCVYFLVQARATKLPESEQQILRNEIFVARGSLKEPILDTAPFIDAEVKKRVAASSEKLDVAVVRQQIEAQVNAGQQVIEPGYMRVWTIDMGLLKNFLKDQPLTMRIKFHSPETKPVVAPPTYHAYFVAGPLDSPKQIPVVDNPSVAAETFHEFTIPPNLWDDKGKLTIQFHNRNQTTLLFPLTDGFEILYRESGFGLNFARGLTIVLFWLALLSAIGLAAASLLSFPVAAFFSISILAIGLSSGTLNKVVDEKTIVGNDIEKNAITQALDKVAVPAFKVILQLINLVQGFSPIDSLSSGRSISWPVLGQAFLQIVVMMSGIFVVTGITIFSRRELARVQVNA